MTPSEWTTTEWIVFGTIATLVWALSCLYLGAWISRSSGEFQARATHAWYAAELKRKEAEAARGAEPVKVKRRPA